MGIARLTRRRAVTALTGVVILTLGLLVGSSTRSQAVGGEEITFVNATGETLWIGAGVDPHSDPSKPLTGLPTLAPGATSAPVVIPDNGNVPYWHGKLFARERCSGQNGGLHCLVGDCGVYVSYCPADSSEQPASLVEFNFHYQTPGIWYDVSYVNAVSLAVTIDTTDNPAPPWVPGTCVHQSCSGGQLLAACPQADAVYDPQRGDRINCINPDRDAVTGYVTALENYGPRAYLWSGNDWAANPQTTVDCDTCRHFVVTFHNQGAVVAQHQAKAAVPAVTPGGPRPAPTRGSRPVGTGGSRPAGSGGFALRGLGGKCLDVPGGISADGAPLQLWDCNGTAGQRLSQGPGGSLLLLGKCVDVAWASQQDGAKVQLANCNGGPAQVWSGHGGLVSNPNSGKCLDVRDFDTAAGAPLQIWQCNPGQVNQTWHFIGE